MSGVYSLYLSVFSFIVEIPKNLLVILDLNLLSTGVDFKSLKLKKDFPSKEFQEKILKEYSETIEGNREIIQKKQENWQNGYNALWSSFRRFLASVGLFFPIIGIREPFLAILASVLLGMFIIFWLIQRIPNKHAKRCLVFNWKLDVGWAFITLYAFLIISEWIKSGNTMNSVFSIIIFLILIALVFVSARMNMSLFSAYLLRTLGISIISFIVYFLFALNEGDFQNIAATSMGTRISMSVVFSGFITTVFMLGGTATRKSIEKAKEAKEFMIDLIT
ncbi:hypothetical protein [Halorussus caseinilyticus]|uniref:Uncharacterized protein n=2 Tax=Halorussus caseinilyticus TaxID=3034025 RepID=A0ABD5WM62_9EURY